MPLVEAKNHRCQVSVLLPFRPFPNLQAGYKCFSSALNVVNVQRSTRYTGRKYCAMICGTMGPVSRHPLGFGFKIRSSYKFRTTSQIFNAGRRVSGPLARTIKFKPQFNVFNVFVPVIFSASRSKKRIHFVRSYIIPGATLTLPSIANYRMLTSIYISW